MSRVEKKHISKKGKIRKKEISIETWVERKGRRGRDQAHDFSSAILVF